MKTNIKKDGIWWIYRETCDRCGEVIFDENWRTTEKPDSNKLDFCRNCLEYFLDINITYKEVKKRYEEGEQL